MVSRDNVVNITRLIDDGPVSPMQIMAMLLCSSVAFLDGVDSQSIAVAAPIIAEKLGLARSALGPIFSAAIFGAMLGALTFGLLGDRFGRKRMLVIATLVFGVFTIATAYASSYEVLLAVRFCAGIGLGGATPCFLALASEYAPKRRRAMVASLIWAAFPLGGIVGGFLNAYILAFADWRTIFLIGGITPLVVALALLAWLPESIRFLLAGNRHPAQAARIAARIDPTAAGASIVADETRIAGAPLAQLFADGRALGTVLLWVPFITAFGTLAILTLWTPALLRELGISPAQTSLVIAVQGLGALCGMAGAGRLMERFGPTVVLGAAFVLGTAAVGAIGYVSTSLLTVCVIQLIAAFFVGLGASGAIALAALMYPTALRSSGIGWSMGMGRGGQVGGTLLTGQLVAMGWGSTPVFLAVAIAPLLGAISVLLIRWHGQSARATEFAA
jgi:AAHS family 4-hydroxybenzoate transporter-like MFS transporter